MILFSKESNRYCIHGPTDQTGCLGRENAWEMLRHIGPALVRTGGPVGAATGA